MVDEHLEARGSLGKATQWQALADEEDEEDHAGAEELDFFNNGLNASTESMIDALDEMALRHILASPWHVQDPPMLLFGVPLFTAYFASLPHCFLSKMQFHQAECQDLCLLGLIGRYIFIGYAAHDYQLSLIYWPAQYYNLTDPSHEIIKHVGLLSSGNSTRQDSIYQIEHNGAVFLQEINTQLCEASPHGLLCPMWSLDNLHEIPFHPATFPEGFPPPTPLASIDLLLPLLWQDLDLFSFQLPIDFDYETITVDPTTTSSDVMHTPASEDNSSQSNDMIFADHQPAIHIHEELHWRQTFREDLFDTCQKKSLKNALVNSPWDGPIRLGKLLYVGHLLVGLPTNPFAIHEADSRWLITTSFLRALHLDLQIYEQLCDEPYECSPLTLNFLDFFIDFTSELRKVVKSGMTSYAGFASNADNQASKILHLIDLFNLGNQEMIQEAITSLINTQGFKEILWRSLFRLIAVLAGGCARLADLYSEAIQTLTGFLGKGIVGVLTTLIYQAFTLPLPLNPNNPRLKSFDIYPIIMIALDDIEKNVLVIDPKSQEPRTMMVNGVKRPRNMSDIRDIVVMTAPELEVPYAQFMLPLSFKAVIYIDG
ncbi:hypothetical protein F4604DRAFT_1673655 [Suillus subluteus]|nr:hypothetical protein F4604DRAFT_1673655 [Suillus subluteus]